MAGRSRQRPKPGAAAACAHGRQRTMARHPRKAGTPIIAPSSHKQSPTDRHLDLSDASTGSRGHTRIPPTIAFAVVGPSERPSSGDTSEANPVTNRDHAATGE